jgi:hypothetical protein
LVILIFSITFDNNTIMASWTDAITQFNPYVSTLPVDAMVKVGMQKQALYEQGVQKIQSQIDQVAGLDILRDVDKNYLQTKLNELGNDLTSVAAADFSNFQLVNSVAGMTKQIARDKNVQNAVSSTAFYRKQAALMDDAIKEGKSSQANIYDFNKKANDYISSTDLNKTFSDRYTPYSDVKKKALDAIKLLHPKLQGYDMPFVRDKNGNIDTRYYADAMERLKIEGVDEGQIKQAIYATLTPDDMNQLSIDAKYQFRDVTPDKLGDVAYSNYKSNLKSAEENLNLLYNMKKTNGDPEKGKEIDNNIAYYQELLGKTPEEGALYKQYAQNIENVSNDPDAVKTEIYKDGFVKEFANAFSWKNQESYRVASPYKAQENFVQTMRQRQAEFNATQVYRGKLLDQSERKFTYEQLKDQMEAATKAAEERAKLYGDENSPWLSVGVKTMSDEEAEKKWIEFSTQVGDRISQNLDALKKAGFNEQQINKMLCDFEDQDPKRLGQMDARALPIIREIAKDNAFLQDIQTKDNSIKAEVTNTGVGIVDGKHYTDWAKQIDRLKKIYNDDDLVAQAADPIGYSEGRPSANAIESYRIDLLKKIDNAESKANEGAKAWQKTYQKKISEKYANVFIPSIKAVGVGSDGKISPKMMTGLAQLGYRQKDLKLKSDNNYDYSIYDKMISGDKSGKTKAYVKQDGYSYKLIVSNPEVSSSDQVIDVSANDVQTYLSPAYVNNMQEETIRLKVSPNQSTRVTGSVDGSLLRSRLGQLPNINKIADVNINMMQDLQNPNLFIPEFTVQTTDGKYETFQIAGTSRDRRVGFEQGVNSSRNLTDDMLLKMIKENYPSYDLGKIKLKP